MKVRVTKDKVDRVTRAIMSIANSSVLIGIPADTAPREDSDETNPELGYLHEYGSAARNIPARPFLVPGVAGAKEKCAAELKRRARKVLGETEAIDKGLEAAGQIARDAVKNHIVQQIGFRALSKFTLRERKKLGYTGESALIRTGSLLNSITYVVWQKNGAS